MHSKKQPKKTPIITGVIDINSKGVGYLGVDGREEDIEIQNDKLHLALDGDEVEVRILAEKVKGREQGEVVRIIKKTKRTFVGVINASGPKPSIYCLIARAVPPPSRIGRRFGRRSGQEPGRAS